MSRSHTRPKHRISHTKSRNGCFACKGRRVKCDEERPICGACSVRGDECSFPSPHGTRVQIRRQPPACRVVTPHHGFQSAAPPNFHIDPIRPLDFNVSHTGTSNPDRSSRSLNMHDLNLLQHYILHTSKKLSLNPDKALVWERVIPDIAGKNAFLMHLLIALAGLDILTTHHPNEQMYANSDAAKLQTLVEHHQMGLQGLQRQLAAVEDTNAEVLFAGSMLIVGFAFGSLRVGNLDHLTNMSQFASTEGHTSPGSPHRFNRPSIQWLQLVRGATFIVRDSWATLKLSRLRPLLSFNNGNEDWKLFGLDPLPTSVPPGCVRSQSISAFALGASRAILRLKEFLNTLKSTGCEVGDNIIQSPISGTSPGSNGNPQLDELFAAQYKAIAVAEQMYLRIIYVLQLQPIESSSSDRDLHAEMEDAAIASWPGLVPQAFISSLDSESNLDTPIGFSFIILAHLYLLLTLPDHLWYLGKPFGTEIKKIHGLITELGDSRLSSLMTWPMNVLTLQPDTQ